jgi:hypothetical protein
VIDGKRWRKSDPSIPEALRSELVHELMAARRAVLAAKRAANQQQERAARQRVHDAKLALGERGEPYWQAPSDLAQRTRAAACIRALLAHRSRIAAESGKETPPTICPSDVARTIAGEHWRTSMQLVRDVAAQLATQGNLRALQRGHEVSLNEAKGPIRLAPPLKPPV